jgi:hypothetical protein
MRQLFDIQFNHTQGVPLVCHHVKVKDDETHITVSKWMTDTGMKLAEVTTADE